MKQILLTLILSVIAVAQPVLYSTPFIHGGEWNSAVTIHNLTTTAVSVPITFYLDGSEYSNTTLLVAARTTWTIDFPEPRPTQAHTGYIKLTPACSNCIAATVRNEYQSPLPGRPSAEVVTSFQTGGQNFTAFAGGRDVKLLFVNPGTVPVMVIMPKLDESAGWSGTAQFWIAPRQVVIYDGIGRGVNMITTSGTVTVAAIAITVDGSITAVPVF
jgi:hypothetical protein